MEFLYNSSTHSALGRSLFEVLNGFSPRHLGIDSMAVPSVPELQEWVEERSLMHDVIKKHLLHAIQRMIDKQTRAVMTIHLLSAIWFS